MTEAVQSGPISMSKLNHEGFSFPRSEKENSFFDVLAEESEQKRAHVIKQ